MRQLILLLCLLASSFIYGQNKEEKAITDEVKTISAIKEEIKALESLKERAGDSEEGLKASLMLNALEVKYEKLLKKDAAEAEQKRMSETLSPAAYDAWKAATNKTQIIDEIPQNK